MTELEEILARLGLSQYLGRLIDEGFEKWETVLDITEQDLAALNFKLGHRRVLQREIASARGVPVGQPLIYPQFSSVEEHFEIEDKPSPPSKGDGADKPNPTGKRKYRRHPKPDEHAPEKPPSAYVMFANRVRDELKGQSLSFTDIAKIVGERWKVLDPDNKEEFEFTASLAKNKYNTELSEYKKTDSYKDYLQYLSEFKARTSKEEATERKKPKLANVHTGSISNVVATVATSSNGSSTSTAGAFNTPRPPTASSAGRGGSISSVATSNTSCFPSPSSQSPLALSSGVPILQKPSGSPSSSPTPGISYLRDILVKATQEEPMESLPSFSSPSAQDMDSIMLPRIHSVSHSPHIQQQLSYSRHQSQNYSAPSSYSRSSISMSVQQSQHLRRPGEESGGPSTVPLPPLEDNRGSYHRALPLPNPAPQHIGSTGYFDQRPPHHHLSRSRSPRSHTYPPPPGPKHLIHSSSYPHPPSPISTSQRGNKDSSGSPGTISSVGPGNSLLPSRATEPRSS